jgi:PAS domain S-box-containing protein
MRDLAVVMLGPQGMVLTWNSGAARIFGHLPEEIIGQQVSRFYPPAAAGAGRPQAHLEEALDRGRFEEEAWRVRKDGSRFWASVAVTPLRDRSGRLRGFGQVVRDLSDRLRADDLLAVLDAAPDAVLGVGDDGRVLFVNLPAARLFATEPSDVTGRPVELLVPLDLQGAGDRVRLEALRGDGTSFPAEVLLRWVPTPRGRIASLTVRDLSSLRIVRSPGVPGPALPVRLPPEQAGVPRPEADVHDVS